MKRAHDQGRASIGAGVIWKSLTPSLHGRVVLLTRQLLFEIFQQETILGPLFMPPAVADHVLSRQDGVAACEETRKSVGE